MRIGIFDSGLGGLIIAKAIQKTMPKYDYVYLGDTKRVPYGNRSHETVYQFTREAVEYLFAKEHCGLVILACNTASARALRRLQKEYQRKYKEKRKILGVLIPTAEEGAKYERVGVLATLGTVSSNSFPKEIKKINRQTKVFQNPAPMLVPLVEAGENKLAMPFIKKYLEPLLDQNIKALILGCTHYPQLKGQIKNEIKKILPKNIKMISQDEIIPKKLENYLSRHQEITKKLSKQGTMKILVTDKTQNIEELTKKWFGKIKPLLVEL